MIPSAGEVYALSNRLTSRRNATTLSSDEDSKKTFSRESGRSGLPIRMIHHGRHGRPRKEEHELSLTWAGRQVSGQKPDELGCLPFSLPFRELPYY